MLKIRSLIVNFLPTITNRGYFIPIVLGVGSFLAAVAFAYNHVSVPVYAVSHIIIETSDADIQSELNDLRSPELAMKVIHELKLENNQKFIAFSAQESVLSKTWLRNFAWVLSYFDFNADRSTAKLNAMQAWSRSVHISVQADMPILDVAVKTDNSALAKTIADTIAEFFTQQLPIAAKVSTARLENLRGELSRAEAERDKAFADAAHKVSTESLREDLSLFQLQERSRKVNELIKQGQIYDAADMLNLPSLRTLSDERRKIKIELEINSKTLLDQHPIMKELNRRLRIVEIQLRDSVAKALQALEDDAARLKASSPIETPLLAEISQRVLSARQALEREVQSPAEKLNTHRHALPAEIIHDFYFPALGLNIALSAILGAGVCFVTFLIWRRKVRGFEKFSLPAEVKVRPITTRNDTPRTTGNSEHVKVGGSFRYDLQSIFEMMAYGNKRQVILFHGLDTARVKTELAKLANSKKILLIDLRADVSDPYRPGIGELLCGEVKFEDVIYPVTRGFKYMPSGRANVSHLGLGLVVATLSDVFESVALVGLDMTSHDMDMIKSSLTSVVFLESSDSDEDIWRIEAALGDEPRCNIFRVRTDLSSVLHYAA